MDIIYANEVDEIVGSGPIAEAVGQGVATRIARIFIFDKTGTMLLQRRADSGRWDQAAGGHVDVHETYRQAAVRELAEEMGIVDVRLQAVAKFYSEETYGTAIRKRHNMVFSGIYSGTVRIDHDEVSDYRWTNPQALATSIAKQPDTFTRGFITTYKTYFAIL